MSPPSARGLFRATGKSSAPIGAITEQTLFGEIETPEYLARVVDEFYPTPAEPTQAILEAEIGRLREFDGIWEPACGDGAMIREMQAYGLTTFASDLIQRGAAESVKSFYSFNIAAFPAILTNPPFAECNRDPGWVRHAMQTLGVEYMALLLPLNWLGASGRSALWSAYPPARIYLMRWRIDFTGQGASPVLNMWAVWDRKSTGETVMRMLDRPRGVSASLFEAAE